MTKESTPAGESTNRIDIRLRLIVPSNTVEGKVLRHLKDQPNLSPKNFRARLIDAVCLLWWPYACEDLKEGDPKQAAKDTIYLLERHIDRIKRDFGLPLQSETHPIAICPAFATQFVPVAQAQTPQPATTLVQQEQTQRQEPPEPAPLDPSFYDSLDVFEN